MAEESKAHEVRVPQNPPAPGTPGFTQDSEQTEKGGYGKPSSGRSWFPAGPLCPLWVVPGEVQCPNSEEPSSYCHTRGWALVRGQGQQSRQPSPLLPDLSQLSSPHGKASRAVLQQKGVTGSSVARVCKPWGLPDCPPRGDHHRATLLLPMIVEPGLVLSSPPLKASCKMRGVWASPARCHGCPQSHILL